jgi:hypothetical protein
VASELGPQEEEGQAVLDVREDAGQLLRGPESEVPVQPSANLPDALAANGGSPFMANAICAWQDCENPSTQHPHLVLRPADADIELFKERHPEAAGLDNSLAEAEAHMSLGVCDEHAAECTVDDLVSDEGWSVICNVFTETGRFPPERSKTEVLWLSLGD